MARTGRRDCIELDAILDSWDGKLTVVWRKRVSRHIDGCDICVERKREVLSPAMLLSVLPLAPLPAGLREHLMWLVSDDSPEAIGYRGRVVSRAGAFDPAGFPLQTTPVGPAGRSGRFRGAGGAGGDAADAVTPRRRGRPVTTRWACPWCSTFGNGSDRRRRARLRPVMPTWGRGTRLGRSGRNVAGSAISGRLGRPNVGPMRDRDIAAALAAGDPGGLAAWSRTTVPGPPATATRSSDGPGVFLRADRGA